ncbi:mCG144729, partial [Mus musculus]
SLGTQISELPQTSLSPQPNWEQVDAAFKSPGQDQGQIRRLRGCGRSSPNSQAQHSRAPPRWIPRRRTHLEGNPPGPWLLLWSGTLTSTGRDHQRCSGRDEASSNPQSLLQGQSGMVRNRC